MCLVTVVIPNWNGLVHLEECFAALEAQTFTDFEVIFVDNDSADDSVSFVERRYPSAEIVRMPENGGFSYAVNEGIRRARGEYVALLNNDTHVEPGWLASLVEALRSHPGYDMAASRMVLYYDRHLMNAAGDVYSLARGAARNRGLRRPVEHYGETRRVLGACAGAALYRTALFDEVGLLGDEFFLTSEDTDFNLRVLLAGRRCMYVPDAVVYHKMRATIDEQPSEWMAQLVARNEAIVVAKDLPGVALAIVIALYPWRLFRSTVPLRPGNWSLIPGLLRTLGPRVRNDIDGFRTGWQSRGDIMRTRRIGQLEALRWLLKGTGRL